MVSMAVIGLLFGVRWERNVRIDRHATEIAKQLDDRSNPLALNFAGRRARLCRVMATVHEAREEGLLPEVVIGRAAERIRMGEAEAEVLVSSLEENFRIAERNGLLDDGSLELLAAGELPKISTGPYAGGEIDFEYVVPVEHAPELESHFANLALRPVYLTKEFGVPFDEHSYSLAGSFYRAKVLSHASYSRVGSRFNPVASSRYY